MNSANTTKLETLYRNAGINVQIEVGSVGFIFYGATESVVREAAAECVRTSKLVDSAVALDRVGGDEDEPEATRWYAIVRFNWDKVDAFSVARAVARIGRAA